MRDRAHPPSPTVEEEPPHKCQRPAAEHFLSSISVNKRCRAYNDGDSKAADYEINARLTTLGTFARVYDLSVFPRGK